MSQTVIEHVLSRLHDLGIRDVFGVPGDYAFPVNDAICKSPKLRWIGCCNELNAAYAADGYARIKGLGALCTTYGVGELSALNGIAGAYAEHLPIFHLVGTPSMAAQASRAAIHHTLGNGECDLFQRMTAPVVCASAVMTPQNVAYETERLIAAAHHHRRPVYMAFPADLADMPVVGEAPSVPAAGSDPAQLAAATDAIVARLGAATTACVLPGVLVARAGLQTELQSLIDVSGLPFATMFMDKTVLDEQQPAYIGMYDGALMSPVVRAFVEGCDEVLAIGTLMSDFNSGAFTARLDPKCTMTIGHHRTNVGGKTYPAVEMADLLRELAKRLSRHAWPAMSAGTLGAVTGAGDAHVDAAALYPRLEKFLEPGDIVVAETGTVSMGLAFARMPCQTNFQNQTLWGSIGWATPAAFGAAVAAPGRRVVLFTGEGSHQFTAQEISQFGRLGLKPVVFVLNNSGYLIERLLCKEPSIAYNDLAAWNYTALPGALGCTDWITRKVATCEELDAALQAAAAASSGVYVEILTDTYAASDLALKFHDSMKTLYQH
jgi:indolepyruvate decarboxylase